MRIRLESVLVFELMCEDRLIVCSMSLVIQCSLRKRLRKEYQEGMVTITIIDTLLELFLQLSYSSTFSIYYF